MMQPITEAMDSQIFQLSLAVLDKAFLLRKPDARARANQMLVRLASDRSPVGRLRYQATLTLINQYQHRNLSMDDTGPTPETAARPTRTDPIDSLVGAGHLTSDHERAARQIMNLIAAMTSKLAARAGSLEPTGGGSGDISDRVALLWSRVYVPWRSGLTGEQELIVKTVLINGHSLFAASRRCRRAWNRTKTLFVAALEQWEFLNTGASQDPSPALSQMG